jgi:5-methylcytosine-specific restriction enzyme B
MAIPKNITKDHLLMAIEKIDLDGLPKDGDSKYYDVEFNGRKYPPKLIVSYANLYANGELLDRNSFEGGRDTQCFKLLEANGFSIVEKQSGKTPNIWVEKTIVKNREDRQIGERALGKCLWSPQKDKRGADIYKNMRMVESGDIILHFVDNQRFQGISKAKSKYKEADGIAGSEWDREAYLIELEKYIEFKIPIDRSLLFVEKYREKLLDISSHSEVFYTNDLELRQGAYLTPCPISLFKLINEMYSAQTNEVLPFSDEIKFSKLGAINKNLEIAEIANHISNAGLYFNQNLLSRFLSALLTKPFVILTGLSGSGKTKLVQAFAKWICEDEKQYKIIPVGADWTNREPLFGYPNALETEKYILPDNGTLSLIIEANKVENQNKPYFLILDEMNLSHVERYFADFLSAMESGESIPLHNGGKDWGNVPPSVKLPKNLFVIGTVNIDETTYMFSPKVLDRANVIEFRVTEVEMSTYLSSAVKLNLDNLTAVGASMGASFVEIGSDKGLTPKDSKHLNDELIRFFIELKKCGAEFGYRSASEINRFAAVVNKLEPSWELPQIMDAAIMQKLLPKVHGSRKKLEPVLKKLAELCLHDINVFADYIKNGSDSIPSDKVKYPVSMEKIGRMYRALLENSFTSYAEA